MYEQKCRYVLADVKAMRDKIKGVAASLKDFGLDPQAGKAKYVYSITVGVSLQPAYDS